LLTRNPRLPPPTLWTGVTIAASPVLGARQARQLLPWLGLRLNA
jgi:hypothetical protein